jgi:hypothetical protein
MPVAGGGPRSAGPSHPAVPDALAIAEPWNAATALLSVFIVVAGCYNSATDTATTRS